MSGLIDGVHGNQMKIMEKETVKASIAWSQEDHLLANSLL